jgi:hypothetical protein
VADGLLWHALLGRNLRLESRGWSPRVAPAGRAGICAVGQSVLSQESQPPTVSLGCRAVTIRRGRPMCKVSAPPPRPAPCAVDRFPSGSRLRVRERYGNEIAGIGEGLVNAALAMPRMMAAEL